MAADDPWAGRRSLRLAEISGRVLVIDRRTGTTTPDLWPAEARPAIEYTGDIDDWLTAISTGRYVGVTPESTVTQYPGRAWSTGRCATPRPSRSAWPGGAMTRIRLLRRPSGCSPPCTAVRDRARRQLARRYRSRIAVRSAAACVPAADKIGGTSPLATVVRASAMCSTPMCASSRAAASRRVSARIFFDTGVNGICPLGSGPGAQ